MLAVPSLSMISHGTDGSDGLESGIHLRWQFDNRLGFPLQGFYLYRRRSCSKTVCINFSDLASSTIRLPYEHIIRGQEKDYRISISSFHSEGKGKDEIILDNTHKGSKDRALHIKAPMSFRLPEGAHAVEIDAKFGNEGFSKITSMMDETEIDTRTFSGVDSKSIRLPVIGANSLVIQGRNFAISKICFDICQDCENPWEGAINGKCGFGLPVKHQFRHARKEGMHKEGTIEGRLSPSLASVEKVAFSPHSSLDAAILAKRGSTTAKTCIGFAEHKAGSILPNPYASASAKFEAKGQSNIKVVDILGTRAISLYEQATVYMPASEYVETKVVHLATGVTIEAYSDDGILVDSKNTGNERNRVHSIFLGKGGRVISKVIFKSPQNEAFLLEFCYYNQELQNSPTTEMTCDPEWYMAACRLPEEKWCQFQGQPFEDLRETLTLMVEGAKDAPMGWRVMSYKDGSAAVATDEPSPEFQISPMDMVLIASVNPYIARILGLYWVDASVADGEVYDYKIVANWPKGTLWNLENIVGFEKEREGKKFFNVFRKESFVFLTAGTSIIDSVPSAFARAKKGLHISLWNAATDSVRIHCTEPVKELQLFVRHQEQSITLEAFHNNTLVDSSTLAKPEGVLAVHHEQNIDYVILRAKDIIIYKICWDPEYIPHGEHSYTICGVKKGTPQPLDVPTGLRTFSLPGMTKTKEDGSIEDHRFAAGLVWDIPKNAEGRLVSTIAPIMYHVQRRTPWGDIEWPTENSPVKVVPESFEKAPLWPKAWPEQRMFYVNAASSPGTYDYRISAVDIFGRMSRYTNWASVDLRRTVPPPPSDIEAKLLDPSDPSLTGDEKAWVTANNRRGLKVRWKWTEYLKRQAPDVSAFNIHFQPGWLNAVQGEIESDPVENGGLLDLYTTYVSSIAAVPENVFAGEKMLMSLTNYNIESSKRDAATGKFIFSIRKPIPATNDYYSTDFGTFKITSVAEIAGSNNLEVTTNYMVPVQASVESFVGQTLTIRQKQYTVLSCKKDVAGYAVFTIHKIYPRRNDFFSIPISHQKEPPAGTFIDYRKVSSWQQMLHTEPLIQLSKEQYEIIISDPPLLADRTNKVVYAQIGISSVNSEGDEGSVSGPTSIIAVFREPPPPQRLEDSPNTYASIPNYYGKSSYALRWRKPAETDVRYFVYRAMDETLFSTDKEIRGTVNAAGNPLRSRDPANYAEFLSNFDIVYRSEIEDKVIKPSTIDYVALTKDPLKNILLKALASLSGNENAFSKLHENAIHPDDTKFANRNTDVPAPGATEPVVDYNLILYVDESIDGNADNSYFYRVRTVNEVGALGNFELSTPPIYLPKIIPPDTPRMIMAEGRDRQIVIRWSASLENNVAGYLLYRSEMKEKAQDIRKMLLLKENPADTYSANAVTDPVFVDRQVEPRKKYYYRAIAVNTISGNGRSINIFSNPSPIVTAQSFDMSAPEPPIWRPATDGVTPNSKVLKWDSTDANLRCLVERQEVSLHPTIESAPAWSNISSWLSRGTYEFEDRRRAAGITYRYRLRVMDEEGRQNREFNIMEL